MTTDTLARSPGVALDRLNAITSKKSAARPVLGIICCARDIDAEQAQAVIHRYVEVAALHADCAVLLVPSRPDLMHADEVADRLDGVLLTGSPSNVAPARYGDAAVGDGPFDPGRDAMSLALIAAMTARGRPVFGICRGCQEINVAFGGSLARDLAAGDRAIAHHAAESVPFAAMFDHMHDIKLTEGGVLAEALGERHLRVNSVHFQGIGKLGDGLRPEAMAPDGVVEACSAIVGQSLVLGVQWHPEWRTDDDPAAMAFFRYLGQALRGLHAPISDAMR